MQISSVNLYQSLAQYGGPSSQQTAVNALARPVIIEGQVLDDRDTKKGTERTAEDRAEKSRFSLTENDQQKSNQTVEQSTLAESATSVARNQPADYSLINRDTGSQNNYADSNTNNTTFPYANRRSNNGLSGSSLVIQSYVSNSPSASLQQTYSPGGVDYYV